MSGFPKSKVTLVLLLAMTLSACGEEACGGAFTGPVAVIIQELFPLFTDAPITPASSSDLAPFTLWVAEANSSGPLSKVVVDFGASTTDVSPVTIFPGVHAGGITSFLKDGSMSSRGLYLWHDTSVELLDASTAAPIATIPVSVSATLLDFAIAPDGKWGYATAANDNRFYIVDLTARKVSSIMNLGTNANPRASVVGADGTRVYVTDAVNSTFYIVDPAKQTFTTKILPGSKSELGKPALRPDGSEVWIPNVTMNTVFRYNVAAASLLNGTITGFVDPREIVFSGNGKNVWILSSPPAGFGKSSIAKFDTGGKVAFQSANSVGNESVGMTLSPLSSIVFVAGSEDGEIFALAPDGKTTSLKVGSKPVGIVASR